MRILRLKLVLLGVMVLGASGCGRETAARLETAAPPAAALAPPKPSTFTPAAPRAATPGRRDWHRLTRRTQAGAPLLRYAAVRRPSRAVLPPLPREARLFDLTLKASEFFRIDPTQAAEVRGREGTVLRLPANALVDAQQRPVQEPVWLELKECYSLAELLLSDCVSRGTSGEALQAQGMLLVRALTGKGQALQLAEGVTLALELPAGRRQGARLYGSPDRQHWAALPDAAPARDSDAVAYAQVGGSTGGLLPEPESSAVTAVAEPLPARSAATDGAVYSPALGWLTCMRPWAPVAETTLLVPIADADERTVVRLVLPEAGIILAGTPQAEGYAFTGVPAQQRAVLVGLRYQGDSAQLALQPLLTGTDAPAPLRFRPESLADLEQRLERLR